MQKYLVLAGVDRDHFCMYFFVLRLLFDYYQYSVYGDHGGIYDGNHRVL